MTNPNPAPQTVTIDDLFRQKGEIVTQLEIAQGRLQMVNQQIQGYYNQQAVAQAPK